ncbi:phosphoribosyl-AMP cyclohydrolase [Acidomonas methanolica]|nr:phosphoribosyl-AMP cyclohydrolase [Acidomonas methanolica]MBU2654603.1 phosphoribosyl-AMP cyclohydrolase [Acidomonas methanolica]TCS27476.1 phosphoribosyl-AMP cyclohydrolase [Acidomonas methanolica]
MSAASLASMLDDVAFDADGLIAAIAQSAEDGTVLMLAWMNREALAETLSTGKVCYYSRSRGKLWRKGETSGQRQELVSARLDCDGDAVLLLVRQTGVACHTGRLSCFYREMRPDGFRDTEAPRVSPDELYGRKTPTP